MEMVFIYFFMCSIVIKSKMNDCFQDEVRSSVRLGWCEEDRSVLKGPLQAKRVAANTLKNS